MKIRRIAALRQLRECMTALIRVVPPDIRSLWGWISGVFGLFPPHATEYTHLHTEPCRFAAMTQERRIIKMGKDKKLVEAITSMETDFAQWYTDVVKKAELIDYSSVKGCMVIKPAGYAIWENIQHELDRRFKETGVENVYMPMFIPESLLQKEKDHVEGFAPEVAWVTHGGLNPLQERLCVRPTSETLFCDFYANDVQSYRDLPKCYNQWCSVARWEKETRPFLRSREFLWQ